MFLLRKSSLSRVLTAERALERATVVALSIADLYGTTPTTRVTVVVVHQSLPSSVQ